ncbi:polyprenyl synthetase family protein [Tessaracoccus massiliensis]|uniref:polyprenyl synthetase family protein n=1 Tax=Tessaracoccus massiliensis TaxID=1522311 RepID=UPI00058B7BDE|nr:polyprenyl synthetase family protein [Tessaracoccus massiliensis]
MRTPFDPTSPLSPELLSAIGETIEGFIDNQTQLLTEVGATDLLPIAREATAGGKRLRPAYCYWSYVAAAGQPEDAQPLLDVASSLDLLHVSALVHDDLIDAADTRRGLPAAHKRFEALHGERGGRGSATEFGVSSAILLGDLLLMWSIELADRSGAPGLDRARPHLSTMRSEVTAGQFLDVSAQYGTTGVAGVAEELDVARRILEYKSASYSIRRPSLIGAALGGASDQLLGALGEFGSVIGRAFQLRDDVLGVYGRPEVTGKPYGGDIHEGKRTVLVLTALSNASDEEARELSDMLGAEGLTDTDIDRAAEIIESTGARAHVDGVIEENMRHALAVLEDTEMTADGRTALAELAERSVKRAH